MGLSAAATRQRLHDGASSKGRPQQGSSFRMQPAGTAPRRTTPLRTLALLVQWLFLEHWSARLASRPVRIAVLLLALPLAAYLSFKAVGNQITETNLLHEDRVNLALYLDGTADKPFVYRVLNPTLVRAAEAAGAPALLRALPGPLAGKLPEWCAAITVTPAATCDDLAAYVAVAGVEVFAFLLLIYAICRRLFDNPLIALFGLGFAFFGVNAVLLQKLSHLYDFGVLMWVTVLLLCLQRGWSIAFTLLLPLAFLTKETLILYAGGFFLADLGRRDPGRTAALFLVQIASYVVIHGWVRLHFAGNPGLGHEYYLPVQIYFFTEQITLPLLLLLTVALLLIFHRFGEKDAALRRAGIVIVPWFVLFLIGGVDKEVRVVFEVLPLLLLFAIDSLVRLVPGLPPSRLPPSRLPPSRLPPSRLPPSRLPPSLAARPGAG